MGTRGSLKALQRASQFAYRLFQHKLWRVGEIRFWNCKAVVVIEQHRKTLWSKCTDTKKISVRSTISWPKHHIRRLSNLPSVINNTRSERHIILSSAEASRLISCGKRGIQGAGNQVLDARKAQCEHGVSLAPADYTRGIMSPASRVRFDEKWLKGWASANFTAHHSSNSSPCRDWYTPLFTVIIF